MSQIGLTTRIKEKYLQLTKAEKKVADFVIVHPHESLQATISDLAEFCGVGETTVFRFCRTLKLKGYQDFRMLLALDTDLNSIGENVGVAQEDSLEMRCLSIRRRCVDALNDTYNMLDYKQIEKAVDLMVASKCIFFFGVGGSGITAAEAKNNFRKISPCVISDSDSHIQLITASLVTPENLVIVFSNSGTTRDAIEMIRLAKSRGAATIFITRFAKTPATQYSDVLLHCGAVEGPMQGGSIAAKISQSYMLDLLYEEYFRRMGDQALENKKNSSIAIADKML